MRIKTPTFTFDALDGLMWQDNQSENMIALMEAYNERISTVHTEFWEDWYNNVYNLMTANEFGLKVWSIILDLPLFGTNTPSPANYPAFGFATTSKNFGFSNFATDSNSQYGLTTEQKRTLLRLRYYQLVSRGNSWETNRFLQSVFGSGIIHVINNQDMSMDAVITGPIDSEVLRAVKEQDLIPRPATVEIRFVNGVIKNWGFSSNARNFYDGNFIGA